MEEKAKAGNAEAKRVLQSWADAQWFTSKPPVAEKITFSVFLVLGETNTDASTRWRTAAPENKQQLFDSADVRPIHHLHPNICLQTYLLPNTNLTLGVNIYEYVYQEWVVKKVLHR